jgi:hypothetical protein
MEEDVELSMHSVEFWHGCLRYSSGLCILLTEYGTMGLE